MNGAPARSLVAAAVVFTVALFVFGSALVRALGTASVVPADGPVWQPPPHDTAAGQQLSAEALQLAVDHDPFMPDRARPAARYRLPGDVDPEPPPAPPAAPPPPAFALRGTTVGTGETASYALIQVGDAQPRFVAVGGVISGFQLSRVTTDAAIVTDGERELLLRLAGPAQHIAAQPEPQRGRTMQMPARNAPTPAQQQQQARERAMQMVEALERARQQGAPPEVLQALQRALEQAGAVPGQRIQINPGAEIIMRRMPPDTSTSRPHPAPDPS
jgi:hypothetical protein